MKTPMKLSAVVVALSLWVGTPQSSPAQGVGVEAASALAAAGADALLYVHCRNPQEFFSKIDALARQVRPNFNAAEVVQLGRAAQNSRLLGVDLTQPITVIGLNPKEYGERAALTVLTASDVDAFLGAVGTETEGVSFKLNEASRSQPIREYSRTSTRTDRRAYEQALAAGQNPDLADFTKTVTETIFVGVQGKQIIVGPNKRLVEKAVIPQGTAPSQVLSGDLMVTCRVAKLLELFQTELQQGLQQLTGVLAMAGGGQAQTVGAQVELLLDIAKQCQTAELAATLSEGNLNLAAALTPVANSELARIFAAQSNQKPELLSAIPPNAALASAFVFRLPADSGNITEQLARMIALQGAPMNIAELTKTVDEYMKTNWTGEEIVYITPPSNAQRGTVMFRIERVKDSSRARAQTEKIIQLLAQAPPNPTYQSAFRYERDVAKIGDAAVDRMTVTTTVNDPTGQQFMTMLGLNEMVFSIAYPQNFVVSAWGNASLEALPQALESLRGGPAVSLAQAADFQNATRGFPVNPNGVFFLSLERAVAAVMAALPPEFAGQAGFLSMMLTGRNIDFAGYSVANANNAQLHLRVPLQRIQDTLLQLQQMFQGN